MRGQATKQTCVFSRVTRRNCQVHRSAHLHSASNAIIHIIELFTFVYFSFLFLLCIILGTYDGVYNTYLYINNISST